MGAYDASRATVDERSMEGRLVFSGEDQSPFHTALVNGCAGCIVRAHSNTRGSNLRTISLLVPGVKSPSRPPFELSGSFHTSQARIRSSFAKAPRTPFTYFSRRGYCA